MDAIHADNPIDTVLITGDLTDAGRSTEWSELLDALTAYPRLADRIVILPGNHDLNIVDRSNPARLDLPTSPSRTLRRLRFLSAADALHGGRVRLVDQAGRCLAGSLSDALKPHLDEMARFSETGRPWLSRTLNELWAEVFPMVLPPDQRRWSWHHPVELECGHAFLFHQRSGDDFDGAGKGIEIAAAQYPHACWIIALHHHVIEYPKAAKVLSERIGTALVNGNWFVRRLQSLGARAVLMHGHRHVDWIGKCAGLSIVSAPSPVMEATDDDETYFYIHTLAAQNGGQLGLLAPERVIVDSQPDASG